MSDNDEIDGSDDIAATSPELLLEAARIAEALVFASAEPVSEAGGDWDDEERACGCRCHIWRGEERA